MKLHRLLLLAVLLSCNAIAQPSPADANPAAYMPQLMNRRVALVINQTSVIGNKSLLDLLLERQVNVVKIFVPEHGFRGADDAGATVESAADSATHLPIVSLYGAHKMPSQQDLADVDVVVYDLQDVGARFYTYISTLEYVMQACAQNHRRLMVLDRPDPNGWYVDGPVLEPENKSFVGMQPIPIVYGMTAGEYARMLAGEGWVAGAGSLDLAVIPCTHYAHSDKYALPVAPSPNLRTMAAIYGYPSLCLFEGTVVSVGRGTSLPFQQFGCPELAGEFSYSFTPQSGPGAKHPPYENKTCYGEKTGETAEQVLSRVKNGLNLTWLISAYAAYPDKEKFFTAFFTKLAGTKQLQEQIANGKSEADIKAGWQPGIKAFKKIRRKYLLYKDF